MFLLIHISLSLKIIEIQVSISKSLQKMLNKYIFKRQYIKHESNHRINLRSYRDSCHVIACPFTQLRVVTDAKTSGIVGRDTRFPRVICESWHCEKVERIETNRITFLSPVFWSEAHLSRKMPAS